MNKTINKIIAIYTTNPPKEKKSVGNKKTTFENYAILAKGEGIPFVWKTPKEVMEMSLEDCLMINGVFVDDKDRIEILKKFSHNNKIMFKSGFVRKISDDKYETFNYLTERGLPTPYTEILNLAKIDQYDYPLVLKKRKGSKGDDVFLIKSMEGMLSMAIAEETDYIVQEYIKETHGKSIRVLYIGEKFYVYGSDNGEIFLSNGDKGGSGFIPKNKQVYLECGKQIVEDLVRDSGETDLVVGIDLSLSETRPSIIELNSFPGISGVMKYYKEEFVSSLIRR